MRVLGRHHEDPRGGRGVSWNTAHVHLFKLMAEGYVKGKKVGRQNQWALRRGRESWREHRQPTPLPYVETFDSRCSPSIRLCIRTSSGMPDFPSVEAGGSKAYPRPNHVRRPTRPNATTVPREGERHGATRRKRAEGRKGRRDASRDLRRARQKNSRWCNKGTKR